MQGSAGTAGEIGDMGRPGAVVSIYTKLGPHFSDAFCVELART